MGIFNDVVDEVDSVCLLEQAENVPAILVRGANRHVVCGKTPKPDRGYIWLDMNRGFCFDRLLMHFRPTGL